MLSAIFGAIRSACRCCRSSWRADRPFSTCAETAAASQLRPSRSGSRRRLSFRRLAPLRIRSSTLIADSEHHFEAGQKELEPDTSTARENGIRQGDRRPARVAVRRPNRAPDPRAFRPAGRPDQRLRSEGARAGRRVHREAVRAGVDRRAAGGFGHADADARDAGDSKTPCQADLRTIEYDIPIPLNQRVLAFFSSSRDACTISSKKGCGAAASICR